MSVEQNGGKGAGLEWLAENIDLGFDVPQFDEIGIEHFEPILKQHLIGRMVSALTMSEHSVNRLPHEFDNIIQELAIKYNGKPSMVRSNSHLEDRDHSFAGIYDSVFVGNVTEDNLRDAFLRVYQSTFSDKARKYRESHGLSEDQMGIIIQRFVKPEWSGVMYTSNPTYPNDLSIEFVRGKNTVVEGRGRSHIVDFDKESGEKVFESENFPYSDEVFDVERLSNVGRRLEERVGPSDVEFVVRNNRIYLVQKRQITDLHYPEDVEIPDYEDGQFVGETNVIRGGGRVTLPIVKVGSISKLTQAIRPLIGIDDDYVLEEWQRYFEEIRNKDEQFKEGYVLVLPTFDETVIQQYGRDPLFGIDYDTSHDGLTPHKKAIITTERNFLSSHVMTVARERGIHYAGFNESQELFEDLQTGDIISMYFQGRKALIFREKREPKFVRDVYPDISFKLQHDEDYISFETTGWVDNSNLYGEDFVKMLNQQTEGKWRFEPFGGVMGGRIVDDKGRGIVMSIGAKYGRWHHITIAPEQVAEAYVENQVPQDELRGIMDKYREHLIG